jgi:RNA polymerase sigma factor (sigma-70 family)
VKEVKLMNDMELVQLALSDSEESIEAKAELLDRCKDVTSYNVFKYKSMFYSQLNHFDVEDLVSECHIAVLESIKLYRPDRGSGFPNFAKIVIRTTILDFLKKRRIYNRVMNLKVDIADLNVAAPEIKRVELDSRIKSKMDRFTEQEKQVIAMMLDGDSQTEIGVKMGVSKKRINNIVRKLSSK